MALNIGTLTARWGKLFGGINEANTFAGTTIAARADAIDALYGTLSAQREVVDGLYASAINVRGDLLDWGFELFRRVGTTLRAMCRDDSARPKSDDLFGWFDKLKRDMVAGTVAFYRPTVSATIAVPGSNAGDGYLYASIIDPFDGFNRYYSYAEVVRIECTEDSDSGTTSAGSESFVLEGETAVDKAAYNWPKGSGAQQSQSVTSSENDLILTDGGLEDWTGNVPEEWTAIGSTGTHITKGTASPYKGDNYCIFTGDGSTTVGLYQPITTEVVSDANYVVQCWVKLPAGTLGTGSPTSLRIALVDGDGTVINDNAGNAQSTSIGAATLNGYTAWTRIGVVLRTPRNLPEVVRLEFKFVTNALDNAKAVYLDDVVMAEMVELYPGGPFLTLLGGAMPFAKGDKFTATVANAVAAQSATVTFVRCLDRAFNLAENGIRLTTEPSGTVSPVLIDETTLIA